MRTPGRRRLDVLLLALGALAGGGIVAVGGIVGDAERVTQLWVGAQLGPTGDPKVEETIDYDFGLAVDRHGIFRTIPGLTSDSPVQVRSTSAPDDIAERTPHTFDGGETGQKLKIGDPNTNVTGRHRYRLDYALPRAALLDETDRLAWDAVGTEWEVPVGVAEVHVVAPWRLTAATCSAGDAGSTGGCEAREVEPGHLVARAEGLGDGKGLTITVPRGAELAAAPALPSPPTSAPPDPGVGLALPAAAAALGGLGSALSASILVRRAGRERVGGGGAADAAWADGSGPAGEVRLDEAELAEMATTEVAPPEGLTAAQGGLLLAEEVRPEHKVAWLIQAGIDGVIDVRQEGKKEVTLVRTGELAGPYQPLASAFGTGDELHLGSYDATFASAWKKVGTQLETWGRSSGLWDPEADRRKGRVRALGVLAAVVGALLAFVGGYGANRWGGPWVLLVVAAALLAGAGFAAALRAWELRVRTPEGSGLWLRVESFRRFLHGSETFHAEEAAKRGVLREYTAWAVALDELDRWEKAVAGSTVIPEDAGLGFVYAAPALVHSTSAASTAPSSSGGGGGGGSVGGGGGGGGGGSW